MPSGLDAHVLELGHAVKGVVLAFALEDEDRETTDPKGGRVIGPEVQHLLPGHSERNGQLQAKVA